MQEIEIDEFKNKRYYYNDQYHREDGPAIEYVNGDKQWWFHGQLHRKDGPAIEMADGTKEWYRNDQRHRIDGPAIEHPDGRKSFFLAGNHYSEEEYWRLVKLKALW